MYILQVIIIGYCGLLAGFLLSRPKQLQHYLLAAFLLTVALIIAMNHGVEVGWLKTRPLLRDLLPLCLGPLFYGFVKALVFNQWRLQWRHSWHFAALPGWLLLRPFLPEPWQPGVLLGSTFLIFSTYLLLALQLTRLRQQQIFAQMGVSQSTSLRWIQRTAGGFLLMVLLELTELLLSRSDVFVSQYLYVADMLLLALLFAGLVWEALRQPDFLASLVFEPAPHTEGALSKTQEESASAADPQQLARLEQFMLQSQIYQQPNLTLQQLSEAMAMPQRQLSLLINQGYGRNFSDFINGYRVRAAAQLLLAEPAPDNMLTLLFQVGFNSKSTFNLMFKREFSCTPSQYRALHDAKGRN